MSDKGERRDDDLPPLPPCESCGTPVMLLPDWGWVEMSLWVSGLPHTPERCRTLRGETP